MKIPIPKIELVETLPAVQEADTDVQLNLGEGRESKSIRLILTEVEKQKQMLEPVCAANVQEVVPDDLILEKVLPNRMAIVWNALPDAFTMDDVFAEMPRSSAYRMRAKALKYGLLREIRQGEFVKLSPSASNPPDRAKSRNPPLFNYWIFRNRIVWVKDRAGHSEEELLLYIKDLVLQLEDVAKRTRKRIDPYASPVLAESLSQATFKTGDRELDALLETAREKFQDPDASIRRESLEKLWDAWERLKTLEIPGETKKKESISRLLGKASSDPEFRQRLEDEAKALTSIGNDFMIRHSEVWKVPIKSPERVDYLFHRMFAMIQLLLRCSGRGG